MTTTARPSKAKRQGPAHHDAEHLIRVVGPGDLVYDVHMTEAQVKEARHFARFLGENGMKKPLNDVIVELLDAGVVSAVSYPE